MAADPMAAPKEGAAPIGKGSQPLKALKTPADVAKALYLSSLQTVGLVVCDVYSTEWGPCRPLVAAFHALRLKVPEEVDIRFYAVPAEEIAKALQADADAKKGVKGAEPAPRLGKEAAFLEGPPVEDKTWLEHVVARVGASQPTQLLFQSGRLVQRFRGVNSPAITRAVLELCEAAQPTAADVVKDAAALAFWEKNFDGKKSVVPFTAFTKAVWTAADYATPFEAAELQTLQVAVGARFRESVSGPPAMAVDAATFEAWFVGGRKGKDAAVETTLRGAIEDSVPAFKVRMAEAAAKASTGKTIKETPPPPKAAAVPAAVPVAAKAA